MKSSKWMIALVAVVLVLALAPSSFAQVQIQLFNTPSVSEITTNHHANTADVTSVGAGLLVSGQLIAGSSLTTTNLILTFPGPITASATALDGTIAGTVIVPRVPSTNDAIRIEGATGLFASLTAVASINYAGGTITISLPGFPSCTVAVPGCNPPGGNGVSGSFRISGIRIDVAGKNAPLTVTSASLSSSANNYIAPTSMPTLISAVGAGIGNFSQATLTGATNGGTALMFANQSGVTAADGLASVLLTEGFASAWRSASQTATTGVGTDITNGSNILLTIGGLPAGVTATLSRIITGSAATQVGVALTSSTVTSAAATTTLSFSTTAVVSCGPTTVGACQNGGANPDLNAIENVAFDVLLTGAPTAVPLAAGSITLAATHTPNSTSGLTAGVPSLGSGLPRFTTATTTVTIGSIGQATSTLLLPFVVRSGTQYDTGIAIANTTKDPFGVTAGGATPTTGILTFNLFPRTITGTTGAAGTQTTITTSATVRPGFNGGGLDAAGALPAGGTWAATLSELLASASLSGDFLGYIFIQTQFVDAHGVSYILDAGRLSSAVPALVLQPPAAVSRNVAGAESLGF